MYQQRRYYEIEDQYETRHGRNIAEQISGDDAYGHDGTLTRADVYYIFDMLHTNIMDGNKDEPLMKWLSSKMDELRDLPRPE